MSTLASHIAPLPPSQQTVEPQAPVPAPSPASAQVVDALPLDIALWHMIGEWSRATDHDGPSARVASAMRVWASRKGIFEF